MIRGSESGSGSRKRYGDEGRYFIHMLKKKGGKNRETLECVQITCNHGLRDVGIGGMNGDEGG